MALQVWLPLNETATTATYANKGLAECTFSNPDTAHNTQVNSGKIGYGYQQVTGTAPFGAISSAPVNLGMQISMFAWVYFTSFGGTVMGVCGNHRPNGYSASGGTRYFPTNTALGVVSASHKVQVSLSSSVKELASNVGNGSREWDKHFGNTALALNTWYHIGFTFNAITGDLKIYVNGAVDAQWTLTTTGTKNPMVYPKDYFFIGVWANEAVYPTNNPKSFQFLGKMNDVRAYDHCLSGREVEELSNAKIMHFPLNNFNHTETIYQNVISDCSGYGYHGSFVGHTGNVSRFQTRKGKGKTYRVSLHNGTYGAVTTHNTIDSNGWINTGAIPVNTFGNNCSVSCWFRAKPMSSSTSIKKNVTTDVSCMVWGGVNGNYPALWLYKTTSRDGINFPTQAASSNNNYFTNDAGTLLGALQYYDDNWHHFVMTFEGSKNSLYIDGVYAGHSKTYYGCTSTYFKIFSGWTGSVTTGDQFIVLGEVSDWRLYATILNADKVQKLYKDKTAIGRNGVVMSSAFEE